MTYGNLKTHGITSETVENFLVDAGAVYYFDDGDKENPDNWTLMGATRDGNNYTVEQEIKYMEVDGVKGELKGNKRIISVMPQLTANFVEMSSERFADALPGSSVADFPDADSTHDQITRSLQIALTDYIDNIALVGEVHGKDQPIVCIINNALASDNLGIDTADGDEAGLSITFSGHFNTADLETEPWEVLYPKADNPIISTTSKIVEDQTDPDITVNLSGDTFASEADAENTSNWSLDAGTTGLAFSEILYVDDQTVVVDFDSSGADLSTTDAGTITLQALAAALTGDAASNELEIVIS